MAGRIDWTFIERSMFPLTVTECQRAGIDVTRWALGQPENSGRALMLVEGTARHVLMRFTTPADADRFFQGMRFVAARLAVPDVHPRDTATGEDTDEPDRTFTLTVRAEGAAFHDPVDQDVPAPGPELARILHRVADQVADAGPGATGHVRDVNGAHVGQWVLTTGATTGDASGE